MPSMWSCLCIKRKRINFSRRNETWKKRNFISSDTFSDVSSSACRQITSRGEFHYKFSGANVTAFSVISDGDYDVDTMTKLLENAEPKKRRRVQDIFGESLGDYTNSEASENSKEPLNYSTTYYATKRNILTKLPGNKKALDNQGQEMESMCGYVPKAMQNVYVSKALEGRHVEDYFVNCRPNAALGKFASAEMCQNAERTFSENRLNVVSIVHDDNSMNDNEDPIPLLGDDPVDNETDDFFEMENNFRVLPAERMYSSEPLIVGTCPQSGFSSESLFVCGTDDDMLY